MFDNLLMKLLEKLAQEVGGKAASFILDEKIRNKRISFDLYHSLRNLEEVLEETENRLAHAFARGWRIDVGDYETLNRNLITRGFVERFEDSLTAAQSAFKNIDDKIEIYGSREEMEQLHFLLGADAETMYLLHDDYNQSSYSIDQWKEVIERTRLSAKKARELVSKFIRDKFPM